MPESEELRLTVTLVDNASQGLKQLQTQMQEIGQGQTADNMRRTTRQVQEMHERGFKPWLETVDRAGKTLLPEFARGVQGSMTAMIGFGAGAVGAGVAIGEVARTISDAKAKFSEFLTETTKLSDLQTITGQHAAEIKKVGEAYIDAGHSMDEGREDFVAMSHAMADLTRTFSQTRQAALSGILDRNQIRGMQQALAELQKTGDVTGQLNTLREYGRLAEENAQKRLRAQRDAGRLVATDAEINQRAAAAQEQLYRFFNVRYLQFLDKPIPRTTQEDIDREQKYIDQVKAYNTLLGEIKTSTEHVTSATVSWFLGLNPVKASLQWIADKMNELDPQGRVTFGPPTYDEYLKDYYKTHPTVPSRYGHPYEPPVPRPPSTLTPPEVHPALPRGSPAKPGSTGAAGKPLGFFEPGSLEDKMLATGGRYSTNIEDVRGTGATDLPQETKRLAEEMKRLNDYLQSNIVLPGGGALGLFGGGLGPRSAGGGAYGPAVSGGDAYTGAGGGRGSLWFPQGGDGADAGRSILSGAARAAGVRGPGGSSRVRIRPNGSDVGPGSGEGAGETPAFSGAGGSQYLKELRAPFAKELAEHPDERLRLAALISLENEGAGTGVPESLMNRQAGMHSTLAAGMGGGARSFYGPVRAGLVPGRMAELQRNPAHLARLNRLIDAALEGSNRIDMYQDQGSAGDPNYIAGGTGVNLNHERFNIWGGYKGHEFWAKWRQEQLRRIAEGGPTHPADHAAELRASGIRRSMVDRMMTHRVEGSGSIDVNVNAPKGTGVRARSGGLFKHVAISRQTQMEPAATSSYEE